MMTCRRRRVLGLESEDEEAAEQARYTDAGALAEASKGETDAEASKGESDAEASKGESDAGSTSPQPDMYIEDVIFFPVATLRAAITLDGYAVFGTRDDDVGCWCYTPQDCLDHIAATHECRARCRERHERLASFLQALPRDELLHSDHEQTFAPGQLTADVRLEVGTDLRYHFSLDVLTVSRLGYTPPPKPVYEQQMLVQLLDCGSDSRYAHLASVLASASAPERVPGHYGVCVACNRTWYITWAMRSLEAPQGALGSACARRLGLAHNLIHAQTEEAHAAALDACNMYFVQKYE